MADIDLVDPELRAALDRMPPFSFSPEKLLILREQMLSQAVPVEETAQSRLEEVFVPGPAGAPDVRILLHIPKGGQSRKAAILTIHGGGYVMGAPELGGIGYAEQAVELDCIIAAVNYRLAPETPFPGPLEDCYAALAWLHAEADRLGIDADRIGVSGQSAGGGLAAALALLARDRGTLPIAFQHLIYPMLDDRTCTTADPHPHTGKYIWSAEDNVFGWSAFLGGAPGGQDVSPYAAAARATDLSGLPPAYISVGSLDLFLEEDMDYALRLTRAGVPTELHLYPGAYHGFQIAPDAIVTKAAKNDSTAALRRLISGIWR